VVFRLESLSAIAQRQVITMQPAWAARKAAHWSTALVAATAGCGLLLLPAWRALAGRAPLRIDGVDTIDDAAQVCQRTDLSGWELVTYAQRLVYRKFACYSCRNLWDTPAQAFRYGMGYCTQYNLALKQLLERLGIPAQAVSSVKVRVADDPTWSMGHTWLRVTLHEEVRDVCAGHAENLPGHVNFSSVAPVWPVGVPVLFLLHLGMIPFCGYLEWRSLLTRRPLPGWMFQAREHAWEEQSTSVRATNFE
jgi:hypothetical protein